MSLDIVCNHCPIDTLKNKQYLQSVGLAGQSVSRSVDLLRYPWATVAITNVTQYFHSDCIAWAVDLI